MTTFPPHVEQAARQSDGLIDVANCLGHIYRTIRNVAYRALSSLQLVLGRGVQPFSGQTLVASQLFPLPGMGVFSQDRRFQYAVLEGKLFFRPSCSKVLSWKLMTGIPVVESVSADGHYLAVMDRKGCIHYCLTFEMSHEVSSDGWRVKGPGLRWTKVWYHLPLVSLFVNLVKDPSLRLKDDPKLGKVRSWCLSRKGFDTLYYVCPGGKKHPNPFVGVTTLYVLAEDGRIYYGDPWLPNKLENEIIGPEDGLFNAEAMAASASTLFVIQRAWTEGGRQAVKMYTRLVDHDTLSANPFLPVTFDTEDKTPLVRQIPAEDWFLQPSIQLLRGARLSCRIEITQCGRGPENRRLAVYGRNDVGKTGRYTKMIYDASWTFEETGHVICESEYTPLSSTLGFSRRRDSRENFEGKVEDKRVVISNFRREGLTERGLHIFLEVEVSKDKWLRCQLYARPKCWHVLGWNSGHYWTIIRPMTYPKEAREIVNRYFGKQKSRGITVEELPASLKVGPIPLKESSCPRLLECKTRERRS